MSLWGKQVTSFAIGKSPSLIYERKAKMSNPQWMDYQFSQQHRKSLIREAEQRRLAKLATVGNRQPSALQTLLYKTGRSLVSVGERLQEQSEPAAMNPALKRN